MEPNKQLFRLAVATFKLYVVLFVHICSVELEELDRDTTSKDLSDCEPVKFDATLDDEEKIHEINI